jgi:chaperone required for assembly of F1-ATPase
MRGLGYSCCEGLLHGAGTKNVVDTVALVCDAVFSPLRSACFQEIAAAVKSQLEAVHQGK